MKVNALRWKLTECSKYICWTEIVSCEFSKFKLHLLEAVLTWQIFKKFVDKKTKKKLESNSAENKLLPDEGMGSDAGK